MDTNKKSKVSLKGLTHTYDKLGIDVRALNNINIDFIPGQLAMLLGPNGAGKSTLLNLLSDEISGRTSGQILFRDRDFLKCNRREKTKYVATIQQDPKLSTVADLTVIEHFALSLPDSGSWIKPVNSSLRVAIAERLKPFGLSEHLDVPVGMLSGGERQILALLIARLRNVEILLLDEPIAALDTGNAAACLEQVAEAVSQGIIVIMVTHDFHVACKHGNRLLGMADGRLIFDYQNKEKEHYEPYKLWRILEDRTSTDLGASDKIDN